MTAEEKRILNDLKARVASLERLKLGGTGVSTRTDAPTVRTTQLGFAVELTSGYDETTGYDWKRLLLDTTVPEFADPEIQLTGQYAFTPDDNRDLISGDRGWLEPSPDADGWVFLLDPGCEMSTVTVLTEGCEPLEITGCFETGTSPPPPPLPTPSLAVAFTGIPEPSGPHPVNTTIRYHVTFSGGTGPYDVAIEFGDGDDDSATGAASESFFAHQYTAAGSVYPRVVVTDSLGATSGPVGASNGNGTGRWDFVADAGTVRRPATLVTAADFAAAADTTLNDVTGLEHDLRPGTYQFEGELYCTLDATGGGKFAVAFGGTASSILYELHGINLASKVALLGTRHTSSGSSDNTVGPTSATVYVSGSLVVTAAGTLAPQFAQQASSGTSTVLAGSWFTVAPAGAW